MTFTTSHTDLGRRFGTFSKAALVLSILSFSGLLGACTVGDDGDGGSVIRETGYLSCRQGTNACGEQLECRDQDDTRSCVTPPDECSGADQSCECLGEWLCGDAVCQQHGNDGLVFSCEGDDVGCGEYALGETWEADNCGNTCTCLEQGEVCSSIPCQVTTCDDIDALYTQAIAGNQVCSADADCQTLTGNCAIGDGSCYPIVNRDLDQGALADLSRQWNDADCGGPMCDCAEPPTVGCVDGVCAEVMDAQDGCGDRALGESWDAEDGCNTCTCTADGIACTDEECVLECADLQASYDDIVSSNEFCSEDADCHHLNTICALGACYEYVNVQFPQEELDVFIRQFSDADCVDLACDCLPPAPAKCLGGECRPGGLCDPYDLGDTWTHEDGCRQCECTFDGVVCSDDTGCVGPRSCGDRPHDQIFPAGDNCNTCVCDDGTESCTEAACPPEPCRNTERLYTDLVNQASACTTDADCTAFAGTCPEAMGGGCGIYVNGRLDTGDLQNLIDTYQDNGCDPTDCACTGTAPAACINGTCGVAMSCGAFAPGDTWVAQDGCNTCTCMPTGVPNCTRRPCAAPTCESIPETYAARVESFRTCSTDDQCHMVGGTCGIGFGGCYDVVNTNFTQADVTAVTDQWRTLGCTGPVCDCPAPPDSIGCVEGQCQFTFD